MPHAMTMIVQLHALRRRRPFRAAKAFDRI